MIEGLDALAVIVVGLMTISFIAWALYSLRFQFRFSQFVFLMAFAFTLGVFFESWIRDTREALLSAVILVLLMSIYLFLKLRDKINKRKWKKASKKLVILIITAALLLSPVLISPTAQAYTKDTHRTVFNMAMECLENDGYGHIIEFLQSEDRYGNTLAEWVRDGVVDADRLDLARNHYYDPTTGDGLTGLNSKDLCRQFYDGAKERWENGEWVDAMYMLGRSIHMVADSTVPHHAHLDPLNGHSAAEDWWKDNQYLYRVTSGGEYDYAANASGYVENNAQVAYDLYDKVVDSNASESNYADVAETIIPLAVETTAGFVQMFFQDIGGDIAPVLEVSRTTAASCELSWSPSPSEDFLEYRVYVSEVGEDVEIEEEQLYDTVKDRNENTIEVEPLARYGTYQFQVVTVLEDSQLTSNEVSQTLGVSLYLAIAGIVLMGLMFAVAMRGKIRGRRKK